MTKPLNTVLIVDDDATARFLIERILRRVGVSQQILTASNGQEALTVLNQIGPSCPELILLDINMPLMNGFEFLQALQHSTLAPLPAKIVLLSSSSNPRDVELAKKYSVAAFLPKPLTEDKLRMVLD